MKTSTTLFSAIIMLVAVFTSGTSFAAGKIENKKASTATALKTDIQQLWEEHTTLTRNVIMCIVADEPGIDEAKDQLLANQAQIADNFGLYYGKEAGRRMGKLLYDNITLTADVMIATRNGHKGAFDNADKKWKENTYAIYTFLSETNATWSGLAMRNLMFDQVEYTTDEFTAVKNNDDKGSATAYNNAFKTAALMANAFSSGIVGQFPTQFSEPVLLIGQK